jgi:hypothetical protein
MRTPKRAVGIVGLEDGICGAGRLPLDTAKTCPQEMA